MVLKFTIMTVIVLLIIPAHTQAKTSNAEANQQLQQVTAQKEKAKQQVAQTLQQLSSVKQKKAAIQEESLQLQQQIDAVSNQLTEIEKKLALLDDNHGRTKEQLAEADQRVAVRSEQLKAIIQSMYMNGTQSYLEVLMGAASFSDFLDRLQDLVLIGGQQKDLLVANKADRQHIGQVELQEKRELGEQKVLLAQEQGAKEQLAAKEQEEEDEDARLGFQIQDLEEQNAQEEQQMLQFASQEAKLISESMKGTLSYRGGKLAWPFAKDYPITSPFGKRTDPINGSSSFHPGIDIGAPKGTDILAAEDGIVVVAQWYGGYGNCVILDHGHGVMTLYGHMLDNSITVKKGETVKRGQKIGEVGMTGRSTGYHLHFGVYVQSKAVPPLNYLK